MWSDVWPRLASLYCGYQAPVHRFNWGMCCILSPTPHCSPFNKHSCAWQNLIAWGRLILNLWSFTMRSWTWYVSVPHFSVRRISDFLCKERTLELSLQRLLATRISADIVMDSVESILGERSDSVATFPFTRFLKVPEHDNMLEFLNFQARFFC